MYFLYGDYQLCLAGMSLVEAMLVVLEDTEPVKVSHSLQWMMCSSNLQVIDVRDTAYLGSSSLLCVCLPS